MSTSVLPCKCVDSTHLQGEPEHTFVTAFIDETIHPVNWDEKGNKGKAGSFSYILCWGKVTYESQITDQRLITQSVDYTGEHEHIERITETAIGKVMLSLIYDYNFSGKVRIFSDNQSAVNHWSEVALNSKLAKSFEKVEVIFIPREKNKRADQLGRTRMLLDMPINAYNEMVRKCARLNELENRIRKLAEECKCDVVV